MNILDRVTAVLQRHKLISPPPPPALPEQPEQEADPYDGVECPKCGCNAWSVNGRIKERPILERRGPMRVRVIRRILPLECDHCNHRWKLVEKDAAGPPPSNPFKPLPAGSVTQHTPPPSNSFRPSPPGTVTQHTPFARPVGHDYFSDLFGPNQGNR